MPHAGVVSRKSLVVSLCVCQPTPESIISTSSLGSATARHAAAVSLKKETRRGRDLTKFPPEKSGQAISWENYDFKLVYWLSIPCRFKIPQKFPPEGKLGQAIFPHLWDRFAIDTLTLQPSDSPPRRMYWQRLYLPDLLWLWSVKQVKSHAISGFELAIFWKRLWWLIWIYTKC